MGGLIQPSPIEQEHDNSRRTIAVAIAVIIILVGIAALLLKQKPQSASGPPPYAAKLQLSDFKMSQAQNFVGSTVTYVDGTVTNAGDQTVSHLMVQVTFKDFYNQVAQIENVPIKVLQTSGPYPDTADLTLSPLAPGQSKPFRIIFEHVSEQWNQAYPELQITDVTSR